MPRLLSVVAVIWAPTRVLGDAAARRDVLAGFAVTAAYAAIGLAAAAVPVLGGVTRSQFEDLPAPPGVAPN